MKITEEIIKAYFKENKNKIENIIKKDCQLSYCKIQYSSYRAEEYAYFDVECKHNVKIVFVITGDASIFRYSYLCNSDDILSCIRTLKIKSLYDID